MCVGRRSDYLLHAATLGQWPNESCGCARHWSWFNLDSESRLAPRLEHVSSLPSSPEQIASAHEFRNDVSHGRTKILSWRHRHEASFRTTRTTYYEEHEFTSDTKAPPADQSRGVPLHFQQRPIRAPPFTRSRSIIIIRRLFPFLTTPYLSYSLVLSRSREQRRSRPLFRSGRFLLVSLLATHATYRTPVIGRNRSNVYETLNFRVSLSTGAQLKLTSQHCVCPFLHL